MLNNIILIWTINYIDFTLAKQYVIRRRAEKGTTESEVGFSVGESLDSVIVVNGEDCVLQCKENPKCHSVVLLAKHCVMLRRIPCIESSQGKQVHIFKQFISKSLAGHNVAWVKSTSGVRAAMGYCVNLKVSNITPYQKLKNNLFKLCSFSETGKDSWSFS